MIDTEFKFDISISNVAYKNKPTGKYGTMAFHKERLSVNDLMNAVKQGRSFMAVLKNYNFIDCIDENGRPYKIQPRTKEDIEQTNIIGVDVDDSEIEFDEYISTISLKPTIAYTTPNDLILGHRYRLIYVIDEPIEKESEFSSYYDGIISTLNIQTNTENKDNRCKEITRLLNGNGKDSIKTFESGLIYSKSDLPKDEKNVHVSAQPKKPRKKKDALSEVEKDFFEMDLISFVAKYSNRVYKPIEKTERQFNENGYSLLTKEDWEIKRLVKDINGNYKMLIEDKRKICVGEDRKKYLFNILQLKRKIKPSVTSDELLFNGAFELLRYIANPDKKITKAYLLEVVDNVMRSKSTIKPFENTKTFEISKDWCKEHDITPNAYKNIVKKELHYAEIGGWYDVSISVGKNLKFAKDNNIKVCRNTLKRFCKENGINPKGESIKEEINNNIAMEELIQNKAENSVKLGDNKVDGTMHHTQQENALQRKYKPISLKEWVMADEYRQTCKLWQTFYAISKAI